MFRCCILKKKKKISSKISKKPSREFTKTIKKEIKTLRKSEFNEKNYEPIFLGGGASGSTFKLKIDDMYLTCKKIKKDKDKRLKKTVKNEIKILKLLSYETHFPIYYNCFESKNDYYLLYKYIDGLDLFNMIQNPIFPINTKEAISTIIYETVLGLEYLFSFNLIHLDIKLENILIIKTKPIRIKIIDLAFCKKINLLDNKLNTCLGTVGYCSPEIMLHRRYSYKSDIWSLGVVLYDLSTGYDLFGCPTKKNYKKYLMKFKGIKNMYKNEEYLEGIDEDCLDLIDNMLIKDPMTRYSYENIKNHKFIINNKYE